MHVIVGIKRHNSREMGVVVCTDLSDKDPHRQRGDRVTSRSLAGCGSVRDGLCVCVKGVSGGPVNIKEPSWCNC